MLLLLASLPAVAEPVLVVNPSVPVNDLKRNEARLIFSLRRSQWKDGSPIRVHVLDDQNPLHVRFCREVLRLYPRQLRRAWDRQTFSGTGQAPNVVESIEAMRETIAREPGAVGYLPRELVDGSVKILEVH